MILRFEHADRTDIIGTFGHMLERAGAELLRACDLIAPVPLHRWRLLKRGYNQSALLAQSLADGGRRAVIVDLLQRVRATASLQGLSGKERKHNVQVSSFRLHPRHQARTIGRRVLLIDDVLTTGATVTACAQVLARAGAVAVDVLVLARGGRQDVGILSSDSIKDPEHDLDSERPEIKNQRRSFANV